MSGKTIESLKIKFIQEVLSERVMMHFKNGWACMKKLAMQPQHTAMNQSLLNLEKTTKNQ